MRVPDAMAWCLHVSPLRTTLYRGTADENPRRTLQESLLQVPLICHDVAVAVTHVADHKIVHLIKLQLEERVTWSRGHHELEFHSMFFLKIA